MLSSLKKLVPEPVKTIYHHLQALLGAIIFLFPSQKLKVIGVTGTDGKTTTVSLIHHILNKTGHLSSMVSTVEAKIGNGTIDTGLHVTTPSPLRMQYYLSRMVKAKSEYAVIEATSHGLVQGRVSSVKFFVGLVTNITHEHLDFHRSFEKYVQAKSKILENVNLRILNADDQSFGKLKDVGSGQLFSFGIKEPADFRARNITSHGKNLEFEITISQRKKEKRIKVASNLFGKYNAYNILAAFACCYGLGIDAEKIGAAVSNFKSVPGRMQFIDEGQGFDCVVDFAHTPASLEAALKSLDKVKKGRLIAVFGSAGDRDKSKRPIMGKVATEIADYSIFTSEDPRSEDANKIINEIAGGAQVAGGIPERTFWKIPDRVEAINTAISSLAQDGDVVAVFGKGHEASMNIKGQEYPWSDEQVARNALKARLSR